MSTSPAFLYSALGHFNRLPYPTEDCTGRVIIVTGANTGLGLEAARHFVRLNAAKVILACRSLDKAEAARRDIEATTQRANVVESWHLDLASVASVKDFADRATSTLDRLDILVNNASVLSLKWALADGHETMITVNVISTFLLTLRLLPLLRRTGQRFNMTPHVVVVSSDAAFLPYFPERNDQSILDGLQSKEYFRERYNTSKLLQLMVMRQLARSCDASGKGHIIINSLNPGFCGTELFRDLPFPISIVFRVCLALFSRSPEKGSRTLMTAAFAGDESHGLWMTNCRLHQWPPLMDGDEGERLSEKFWHELLGVLDDFDPGVSDNI
ncbi:hypothetical protein L249_4557 [Ophiocordyceps polyrhachis-furcata BCC 54312]|uniref:Ketoreductase (KR) domain-containing protein n=1 Tax=Ophiocordyceps polyrhachis-furcata BCC 54312 TaxID=1330021 RepID=A0A367KZ85_9HYPO|nr:hypothetical protein L249_4557 [Ophiocordyceps polyrhachis-furcata BCC 54312]